MSDHQMGLFEEKPAKAPIPNQNNDTASLPLAHQIRPREFAKFIGLEKLLKNYPFLNYPNLPSMILYGPPGCGKTTLAELLAADRKVEVFKLNAINSNVAEVKKIIERAKEMKRKFNTRTLLFFDEIHRFNKGQQDAFLASIEKGEITLIGATTEFPKTSLNRALLSRCHIVELAPLSEQGILSILKEANLKLDKAKSIDLSLLEKISQFCNGDARVALNLFEALAPSEIANRINQLETLLQSSRLYDKNGNRHYDVISAFIKSMRGSDPDAALLWLAVMLEGGEDPYFIARRLVIFASEDISNAEPMALQTAVAALNAVKHIGMPEARLTLAQATTFLASSPKSNASYVAINKAIEYVRENPTIEVPEHLKNYPRPNTQKYLYPHNYEDHYVDQPYSLEKDLDFYRPTNQGKEKNLKDHLEKLTNKT